MQQSLRSRWTGPGLVLLLWICLGCSTAAEIKVEEVPYNMYDTVTNKEQAIYNFTLKDSGSGMRVSVEMLSKREDLTLLVDVRQKEAPLSFRVPLLLRDKVNLVHASDFVVSRTLCPPSIKGKERQFYVDVSTLSMEGIRYKLNVDYVKNFILSTNQKVPFTVSASQPQYFKYVFDWSVSSVIVNVSSEDTVCSMLSIQNIQCPVYDLNTNVDFTGIHQTITTRGAITVQKKDFTSFYVVVVVNPSDEACSKNKSNIPNRTKTLEVVVSATIKQEDYANGIEFGLGIFLAFYPLTFLWGCLEACLKKEKHPLLVILNYLRQGSNSTAHSEPQEEHGPLSPGPDLSQVEKQESGEEDGNREFLFVSDLDQDKDKKTVYIWNIITVAVFYGKPVIQVFIGYQTVVNAGNQDMCYYNFRCAHSWGHLRAFNNVFSNLGYVLLGILFIIIVGKRHLHHRALEEHNKRCGIPKHFGLFYAMGIALLMEGVLSGCYHVCPKNTNFQFDTSFMYMMAGLSMLQLYQKRHPDITASAHVYFFLAAIVLIFVLMGEFSDKFEEVGEWVFWSIFSFIHILVILYLTMQLYYTSRWTDDSGVLRRVKRCIKEPLFCDRVVLLVIVIVLNFSLALLCLIKKPEEFTDHLLHIFIGNQLLYFCYYMIMKCRSKEMCVCCPCVPVCSKEKWLKLIIISILTAAMWIGALICFKSYPVSKWEKTPAESREHNKDCILLSFYDHHDVWHFLSAIALFGTFLVLLIIDENLDNKPRDKIRVF